MPGSLENPVNRLVKLRRLGFSALGRCGLLRKALPLVMLQGGYAHTVNLVAACEQGGGRADDVNVTLGIGPSGNDLVRRKPKWMLALSAAKEFARAQAHNQQLIGAAGHPAAKELAVPWS